MPVLLAVRREDYVARIELDDVLAARLDEAAAFGDLQRLPARVRLARHCGLRA